MAAAARDMEPMKGRGHDQKEKWGIRKVRELGSLGWMDGSEERLYCQAVPKGWSSVLRVKMVSGRGVGEVRTAR